MPTKRIRIDRPRCHPTTSERVHTADEVEFMMAIQALRDRTGDSVPSPRQILSVARGLGYVKGGARGDA